MVSLVVGGAELAGDLQETGSPRYFVSNKALHSLGSSADWFACKIRRGDVCPCLNVETQETGITLEYLHKNVLLCMDHEIASQGAIVVVYAQSYSSPSIRCKPVFVFSFQIQGFSLETSIPTA